VSGSNGRCLNSVGRIAITALVATASV
jgi:hypothetical protein